MTADRCQTPLTGNVRAHSAASIAPVVVSLCLPWVLLYIVARIRAAITFAAEMIASAVSAAIFLP